MRKTHVSSYVFFRERSLRLSLAVMDEDRNILSDSDVLLSMPEARELLNRLTEAIAVIDGMPSE